MNRRRIFGRMLAALLTTALALSDLRPAELARAAPARDRFELDIELKLVPDHLALCVGQTRSVEATVYGARWRAGSPRPPSWPQANIRVKINYASGGRDIAEAHADELWTTEPGGIPVPSRARFTVTAKKVGSTMLIFTTKGTLPRNGPYIEAALDQELKVDVTSCYEAQTSALATDWTLSNVCNPDKPFKLQGSYPNLSSTSTLSFYPDANDWHTGTYVLVQTAAVICRDESSGPYKFTEYPEQKRADIDLIGRSISFCPLSDAVRTPNVQYAIELLAFDPGSTITGSCAQLSPP